jgi:hypothetical protein
MHAIICLNTSSSICCCAFGPTHLGECDPQLGYVIQLVAHLRSHPINAVRPWSALPQGAAQAELARSYGVSQSTISRLAAPGPFGASAVGA